MALLGSSGIEVIWWTLELFSSFVTQACVCLDLMPEDSQQSWFFLIFWCSGPCTRRSPNFCLQCAFSWPLPPGQTRAKDELSCLRTLKLLPSDLCFIVDTHPSLLLPLSGGQVGGLKTWNHFPISLWFFFFSIKPPCSDYFESSNLYPHSFKYILDLHNQDSEAYL